LASIFTFWINSKLDARKHRKDEILRLIWPNFGASVNFEMTL
jgi:hypothetical protein